MEEIVLATHNPDKRMEIEALLVDIGIRVRNLTGFPSAPEVLEDGQTCQANAIKKASAIADHTGLTAIADDTGLEVDALDGRPGVYAARYAGPQATYVENCKKLLRELDGVPVGRRGARFVTVVAIVRPGSLQPVTVEGTLKGIIAQRPAGTGGFGYDPVFFVPDLGKTLAELTPTEKNRMSHRAQAFAKAKSVLKGLADGVHVEA